MAAVFLLVNVFRLSSAVLAEELMAAFRTSGAALGTLHASFFYLYALMQLPTGVLTDRVGPTVTVTLGAIVFNAGALGFAVATSYPGAFLARALIGLGGALVFVSILRFAANWFRPDEFATMSGLTIAVAGLGGILATTPLAIAASTFGWRNTVFGLGLGGLVLAGLVYWVSADRPADAGFEPVNENDDTATTLAEVGRNLRRVLLEPVTWVLGVMLFCAIGLAITLFGLWGVPYVVQVYDLTVTQASWFTLLGSVGLLVGPPAFGWLSDRLGRRTVLLIAGGVGYTAAFGLIAVTGRPPWPAVAAAYFAVGGLLGAFTLSFPVIKERHATDASGVSTSTINGAGFLGAAVFPTVLGFVLDSYWTGETIGGTRIYTETGYRVSFAIGAAASVVALACAVWIYRTAPRG